MRLYVLIVLCVIYTVRTYASCFVDFKLNCSPTLSFNSPWGQRPATLRTQLLQSTDVQKNINSCVTFLQLIKTECQIPVPLTAVYSDDNLTSPSKVQLLANDFTTDLYDKRATLPKAFKDYFNANLTTEIINSNPSVIISTGPYFKSILDFLKPDNQNSTLTFPLVCRSSDYFSTCGIQGRCFSSKNPSVGDTFELRKVGNDWCDDTQILNSILNKFLAVVQAGNASDKELLNYNQTQIANFSSFGQMPLISQVSGYIQGLTTEKYATNLALPGLCVATSEAMTAMGLKALSAYSFLGNKFDDTTGIANGVQNQEVRSNVADPNSNVLKRYRQHAAFIDEIARAGGLLSHFPDKYSGYYGFFNNMNYVDGPNAKVQNIAGYAVYFDQDYKTNKPTQDYVENNYQSWIASNQGVALNLLSSHSQPPKNDFTIVGHSISVNGYSGTNMIVYDPWQVVSHIQFANYTYPNAGQLIEHISQSKDNLGNTFPDYNSCISGVKSRCQKSATSCADSLLSLINNSGGGKLTSVVGYCTYSGGTFNYNVTVTNANNACLAASTCTNGQDIKVADGNYRMATFVGNTPGYIGTNVGNTRSAAYIRGYMKASPWPARPTEEQLRKDNPVAQGITQSNPPGQTCTSQTIGKIKVGAKNYAFLNPIPKVTANLGFLSSSTAIQAPCRYFREIQSDGSYKTQKIDLFGTFTMTCENGKINIVQNSCGELVQPRSCSLPYASKAQQQPKLIFSADNKFQYYSDYNTCAVNTCQPGFYIESGVCTCEFKNSYNTKLSGEVINNQCTFNKNLCPQGTIFSPYSYTNNPICVQLNEEVVNGEYPSTKKEILTRVLRDVAGNDLSTYKTANAVYGVDSKGYLTFLRCASDKYGVKVDASGKKYCELLPDIILKRNIITRLSSGKNKDGSCRDG